MIHAVALPTFNIHPLSIAPVILKVPPPPAVVTITFIIKGCRHVTSGPGELSLLDLARQAKIPTPYSCGTGNCGTCRAKLTNGAVARGTEFALSEKQKQQATILVCVARAASEKVTLSYDEPG